MSRRRQWYEITYPDSGPVQITTDRNVADRVCGWAIASGRRAEEWATFEDAARLNLALREGEDWTPHADRFGVTIRPCASPNAGNLTSRYR